MRFAIGGVDRQTTAGADRGSFADEPTLADTGRPHHIDHTSGTADGLIQDRGDGVEFPGAPDQFCLVAKYRIEKEALAIIVGRVTRQYGVNLTSSPT
jgi:hypothetical protein